MKTIRMHYSIFAGFWEAAFESGFTPKGNSALEMIARVEHGFPRSDYLDLHSCVPESDLESLRHSADAIWEICSGIRKIPQTRAGMSGTRSAIERFTLSSEGVKLAKLLVEAQGTYALCWVKLGYPSFEIDVTINYPAQSS